MALRHVPILSVEACSGVTDKQLSFQLMPQSHAWQPPIPGTHHSAWRLSIASMWHTGTGCPICSLPPYDTMCYADKFCVWKPKGAPVPLPPDGMVRAVLATLSFVVLRLVTVQSTVLKHQKRVSSKQDSRAFLRKPPPLEIAQHREVVGEPIPQPKLHYSVLFTSGNDKLIVLVHSLFPTCSV